MEWNADSGDARRNIRWLGGGCHGGVVVVRLAHSLFRRARANAKWDDRNYTQHDVNDDDGGHI